MNSPVTTPGAEPTPLAGDEVAQALEAQPPSEREKWLKDVELRERQMKLAERAHEVTVEELRLKQQEVAFAGWRSPLVVAILAATIAALGNAGVALTNGTLQRRLEDEKSEQTRILEMIKTGNPDKAAENLKFLLDSGLISKPETARKIGDYLAKREPGSGTALPSAGGIPGGIVGEDDAKPVEQVAAGDPIRAAAKAVGRLQVLKKASVEI